MRTLIMVLSMLLLMGSAAQADTRMDVGATIVNGNLRGFYLSLGEYYRVPEREILIIRDRHIRDHEIPVVLFLAQRVHVAPGVIIDMRLAGRSWMDITLHFGLGPDIYYIPVTGNYGPPYGHAYGHFKHKHRKDWHKIRLADDDVVNLVNLRFMSEHYGRPADEVIRLHSGGSDFVGINEEFRRGRKEKDYREPDRRDNRSWEPRGGKDRDYREPDRRDDNPRWEQRGGQQREYREQERRENRAMEQRGGKEPDYREPDRRDNRSWEQRGGQQREYREQERREGRFREQQGGQERGGGKEKNRGDWPAGKDRRGD